MDAFVKYITGVRASQWTHNGYLPFKSRSAAVASRSQRAGVGVLPAVRVTLIGYRKTRDLVKWEKRKRAHEGCGEWNGFESKV